MIGVENDNEAQCSRGFAYRGMREISEQIVTSVKFWSKWFLKIFVCREFRRMSLFLIVGNNAHGYSKFWIFF